MLKIFLSLCCQSSRYHLITNVWYNSDHLDLLLFVGYSIASHPRCFFRPGDLLPVQWSVMELNCRLCLRPPPLLNWKKIAQPEEASQIVRCDTVANKTVSPDNQIYIVNLLFSEAWTILELKQVLVGWSQLLHTYKCLLQNQNRTLGATQVPCP